MTGDQGGTVRYHRAEYDPNGVRNLDCQWLVWFTDDPQRFRGFTAAEGEQMGLTSPAPQATITLADGRSVTIDEDVLRHLVTVVSSYPPNHTDTARKLVSLVAPLFADTDEATP